MEKLGEILKKKMTLIGTSKGNTGTWLNDNTEHQDISESNCSICHGAHFIHPLSDSGRPDFSKIVSCRCTQEQLKNDKLAHLQKYSNLGALSRLTFDNLLPNGKGNGDKQKYNFKQSYDIAKVFASNPKGWLIFVGPNGCGKTHLVCAIANSRIFQGQPALYIGVADLLDHLRSTFHPNSDIAYDDLFERVKSIPLLVLDDLTMAVTSLWARGKLEQLLNYRFNMQLPTVITTRVPIEELDENLRGHLSDPEFCTLNIIQPVSLSETENFDGLGLGLLRDMSFKNFDYKRLDLPLEKRQNLEQVYQVAVNFAQSPQGWLILLGQNGCGKTHLAAAIANQLRQSGKSVMFIVVHDLLDHLRSAFSPESSISYDELFEKVKKAEILVLDDFGEQSITSWAQDKLYQLINFRYNARLATVITSCNDLDDIESRISSRMIDPSISLVFNITAPDYRGGNKKATKVPPYKLRRSKQ
jgi:DNA replication protein DnaC